MFLRKSRGILRDQLGIVNAECANPMKTDVRAHRGVSRFSEENPKEYFQEYSQPAGSEIEAKKIHGDSGLVVT